MTRIHSDCTSGTGRDNSVAANFPNRSAISGRKAAYTPKSAIQAIGWRIIGWLYEWRARRVALRLLRHLQALDDATLDDIGITRDALWRVTTENRHQGSGRVQTKT